MDSPSEGDRLISAKELLRLIPYSRMHVSRLEKSGKFPRRIKLSSNGRVGWSFLEVQRWIRDRKAERDAEPAKDEGW